VVVAWSAPQSDEKALPVEFRGDRDEPPKESDHRVLLRLKTLLGREHHLEAGKDQEDSEQQNDPVDPHQDGSQRDEDGAEDERAEIP
jgi:hypothetical protein